MNAYDVVGLATAVLGAVTILASLLYLSRKKQRPSVYDQVLAFDQVCKFLIEQHAGLIQELDRGNGTMPNWRASRDDPKGWLHNLQTAIKMLRAARKAQFHV